MTRSSQLRIGRIIWRFLVIFVPFAILSERLLIPTCSAAEATSQNAQGPVTPQPPGGPQDAGGPIIILETGGSLSGAVTVATVLNRGTDLEHATDPQTGRNFNWDSATNSWVNSQTGQSAHFAGYLCLTPQPPTSTTNPNPTPQSTQGPVTPQPPGGPQDAGGPIIILETGGSLSGAVTVATVLNRGTDLEHATDPQTGRNFNWDSATNSWVNSQTGQSAHFAGYLCLTSGSSAPAAPASPTQAPPSATPKENKTVSTSGFEPTIQLRGFGGASFINGNTPATAGFDGAVLFPLGNRVWVGPTAGFQWVNSSVVQTIGGGPPPSTFIHTSVGFKNGNFGGRIAFPFGGWQLGIHGGATVAGSTITQATGFCSGTGGSLPPGCTVLSTTTTHDTVVGPFVGGYISHSIFSHVGVFVGYDYHLLKDTKPNATNPSGPSTSVFDLHYSDVHAGLVLSFGRHAH